MTTSISIRAAMLLCMSLLWSVTGTAAHPVLVMNFHGPDVLMACTKISVIGHNIHSGMDGRVDQVCVCVW